MYFDIYHASDSVTCIICSHNLIMQLKQQILLPAASAKPRVVQSATCLDRELTSPRDVQSASWQSASYRICEFSSYPGLSCNSWFLGPFQDHNPNGMVIDSAVFTQVTAECPHTLLWAPLSPKIAPSYGNLNPLLTYDSLGPSEPTTEMASRSVLPFLHRWLQRIPILYNGTPLSPSKLPFSAEGSVPHLIHGSLGPPKSSTQTASRLVQPFLQDSLVWQTNRPCCSFGNNRPHLRT